MYGLADTKRLNEVNHREQQRRAKEAQEKAEAHAASIEYDDETGHGISEEETVVSDQA